MTTGLLRNGDTDPDTIFNPVDKPLYRRWRPRGQVKSFAIGADLNFEKINDCSLCNGRGHVFEPITSTRKRMVSCTCQKTKEH
jgi:hypothetical protein